MLNRPQGFAVFTLVLLVSLAPAVATMAAQPTRPCVAALGNANGAPEPTTRPWHAVNIAFGTNRPPRIGTVVTIVPGDPSLPVVPGKVAGAMYDDHDRTTAVHLEKISNQEWVTWRGAGPISYYFPRVLVLMGHAPNAQLLDSRTAMLKLLPPGTRRKDIIILVARNGGRIADVVARFACKDGSYRCEEWTCNEIWVRDSSGWRMEDQICGD